jgi:hypothetical protein
MILDQGTDFSRSRSFLRQPACRFADNLQVPHEPVLNELVRFKGFPSTRRIAFDIGNPVKDISEAFLRVSHKGDASLIMRSRIRALSPRSVTTSTPRPTQVEQSPSRVHIDQEVHVAVRACFTADNRAENPDVVGAMSRSDSQDFLSPVFYEFFNSHDFEFYAIQPQVSNNRFRLPQVKPD